jgi:uncharacterized protein
MLRRLLLPTFQRIEAEAEAYRNSPGGKKPDIKTMSVLVLTAVCLTGTNFTHQFLYQIIDRGDDLSQLLNWVASTCFWYCVLPILAIKFLYRERIRDYGVKLAGWTDGWPLYLVFVCVMVPLVVIMSSTEHFQRAYPFYRTWTPADGWGKLLLWELAYAAQFVALEFFFRGFLVHGLKHRFGIYSLFVMTVPYCMIHFGKPFAECVASIIAGVVLGFMSLKTRSVWLGAALHISVAWGMDTASLWRRGLL